MENNKLLLIIIGILLLAASVFSLKQCGTITNLEGTVAQQTEQISELESNLEAETTSKNVAIEKTEALTEANTQLEEEKVVLNKQINKLRKEIKNLKLRIKSQTESLVDVRTRLSEKENKILALESDMVGLNRKNRADRKKIEELEAQKQTLNAGIDQLNGEKLAILSDKDSLVNQMIEKQDVEEVYKEKMEIIENTTVNFQSIIPSEKENGKAIKRIKKNNWNFTAIELSMYHDNMLLIENEDFVVKVIDAQTREPLALRQSNPQFPDSKTNAKALPFVFTENPVTLKHFNNENKKGNTYEVGVYYVVDGREFLLRYGVVRLVNNGKFEIIGQ